MPASTYQTARNKNSRNRFLYTAAITAVLLATCGHLAQSQQVPGTAAKVLEVHDIPGTDHEMILREVTLQPGASATPHHHTVAGLVYIIDGIAESAYGNEAPRLYHAGETMQDKADIPHTLFRNADSSKPLRFVTFHVAAKGQPYVVIP